MPRGTGPGAVFTCRRRFMARAPWRIPWTAPAACP